MQSYEIAEDLSDFDDEELEDDDEEDEDANEEGEESRPRKKTKV